MPYRERQERIEYLRHYYQNHKQAAKEYKHQNYLQHKAHYALLSREWTKNNPEKARKAKNDWYTRNKRRLSQQAQQLRTEIFKLLGDKCIKCGFSNIYALQIDHVNGGGHKALIKMRKNTKKYYMEILDHIKNGSKEYQLLCANCNWIKRYENEETNKRR